MTIKFHRHQTSKENVKEMPSLLLEKQWRVGACDEHKKLKKQRRTHRDMFLIIPSTAATAAPIQPNLSSTKDLQTCCDCCVTPSSWYPPPLWEWWSQSFEDCKLNCSPCWLCRTRTPCSCFFMEVVELCPSLQYIFFFFFFLFFFIRSRWWLVFPRISEGAAADASYDDAGNSIILGSFHPP